jgi:hypothetical protein
MVKWGIWLSGAIALALLWAAADLMYKNAASAQPPPILKYCSGTGAEAARIYACEKSVYLVRPYIADFGPRYVSQNGTLLAQCNGFIATSQPSECLAYLNYSCDLSQDICNSNSTSG